MIGTVDISGKYTLQCSVPNSSTKVVGLVGEVKGGVLRRLECSCYDEGICRYPGSSYGKECNAGNKGKKPTY
ncbi:hypothetical protein LAT59_02960 [Candidatus Gracilibacteria bacterium]|nr:hypothetical protein [Candidatus Gracilibacteria bacterium]